MKVLYMSFKLSQFHYILHDEETLYNCFVYEAAILYMWTEESCTVCFVFLHWSHRTLPQRLTDYCLKGLGILFCTARHSRFLRAQSPPSPFYIGTGLMFHPAAQLRGFITRLRWTEIVASLQHVVLQESYLLYSNNTVWNLLLITTVS
jgi:hypothetical protein